MKKGIMLLLTAFLATSLVTSVSANTSAQSQVHNPSIEVSKPQGDLQTPGDITIQGLTYGPWGIRPTDEGDFDSIKIVLDRSGTIKANVVQYGIHSGQKAHTLWELYDSNYNRLYVKDLLGDYGVFGK
ncbi:hypothetical protein [Brevibacillus sp. SYSU BS000544]|uniref:hypothetical protein n=1 Tax=Brevibacillus sp. SYSU BS000544 TaxID=3416443 RepID=UPI003CE457B7